MHILVHKFYVMTDKYLEMKFLESELTFTDTMDKEWYFVFFSFLGQRIHTFYVSLILTYYFPKRIIVTDKRFIKSYSVTPGFSGEQMNQGEPEPSIAPLGATPGHMAALL